MEIRSLCYSKNLKLICTLVGALLVRIILVIYGEWQDQTLAVGYTDVDYYVFTDAAAFVSQGSSPYLRHTYRYTPILAWVLVPNILLHQCYGKLFFICCDLFAGLLIFYIMERQKTYQPYSFISTALWLYNPLTIAISSRGNSESVIAVLLLASLHSLINKQFYLFSILYASAIHFKIYAIIFAPSIYFFLGDRTIKENILGFHTLWNSLKPNILRFKCIVTSGITLSILSLLCLNCYGEDFIRETYTYHLIRKDIRHNFSLYFYFLYLLAEDWFVASLIVFLPQLVLLLTFSIKFYRKLPFCWFLVAFMFVTFNKVCTSQYFVWYLSLLSLAIPHISLSYYEMAALTGLWFTAQGFWLSAAYLLEFQGWNTFPVIWSAGIIFFIMNCIIMAIIIRRFCQVMNLKKKK